MSVSESPVSSPTPNTGTGWTDVEQVFLGNRAALGGEVLSDAEERFERRRKTIGWFLAPVVTIVMLLLPLGLPDKQHTLSAILLGVIVLWVCEPMPIPISGLLGIGLIVLLGAGTATEVLTPFGSTTIFTFIGAFILAQAMLKTGVAKRLAFWMLSLPGVGRSTVRVIVAFGIITALLSAFVSNTATVAMLLPTAIGIVTVIAKLLQERGDVRPDFDPTRLRVATAFMLMLAYSASIGGLLTPVGSPPNLIGRGLIEKATGKTISFGEWVAAAFPIVGVMFVILVVILLLINKPELRRIEGVEEFIAAERARMGKMSRGEINTLIAFGITVVLWILPSIIGLVAGTESSIAKLYSGRLNEGTVAILGAALLFILPLSWKDRTATIDWDDAARIDWGTIILFGCGIIFGAMLETTGLAKTLGEGASKTFGVTSGLAITVFAVIVALIISETTSNTASAAVVVPIVIPLAVAIGVDPFVPALAATFGASFGFMLPVSTPPNAIVYGSGVVPITKMIKSGISFDILGAIAIILLLPAMVALVGIGR